jgi:hypothetical protein
VDQCFKPGVVLLSIRKTAANNGYMIAFTEFELFRRSSMETRDESEDAADQQKTAEEHKRKGSGAELAVMRYSGKS